MEIECPNCGFDDCYHNGSCYECPDCGYTWTDDDDEEDEDDDWWLFVSHFQNAFEKKTN